MGVGLNANARAKQVGLDRVGFRAPAVPDINTRLQAVGFTSTRVEALNNFTVLTGDR